MNTQEYKAMINEYAAKHGISKRAARRHHGMSPYAHGNAKHGYNPKKHTKNPLFAGVK